jgi:hypothetical protein
MDKRKCVIYLVEDCINKKIDKDLFICEFYEFDKNTDEYLKRLKLKIHNDIKNSDVYFKNYWKNRSFSFILVLEEERYLDTIILDFKVKKLPQ